MNALLSYLQRSRERTLDRSPSAQAFANIYYSGTTYSLWRAAAGPTTRHSKGLVLDAGSGRGAWKDIIERGSTRESVDIAPKAGEEVTWVADLTSMPSVPSERYDAVICHQVLEHVPDPSAAATELHRVIKPGGVLVLSAPHLSRQHELPHDYFRFTPAGLERLLSSSGFEVTSMRTYGGLFTFVHHQFSTLLLQISAAFYPLYFICLRLNALLSIITANLDRLDRHGLLANGVVAVARRPMRTTFAADGLD